MPNSVQETTWLVEAAQWKAPSEKEMESLRANNMFTLVPSTVTLVGIKFIDSRWMFNAKKTDNAY